MRCVTIVVLPTLQARLATDPLATSHILRPQQFGLHIPPIELFPLAFYL